MPTPTAPFSRRVQPKAAVENAFPERARTGLLHLLTDFVEKQYVKGWHVLAQELRRLDRRDPGDYQEHDLADVRAARDETRMVLNELHWANVFDFCERLYTRLAIETTKWVDGIDAQATDKTVEVVREEVAAEIRQLFVEEAFAYTFVDGVVVREGNQHTMSRVDKANVMLNDPRLEDARQHFRKALGFFRQRKNPDFENVIKEALCAVESAAKKVVRCAEWGDLARCHQEAQRRRGNGDSAGFG